MPKILSLEQLIQELHQATIKTYPTVLKDMQIPAADFKPFETWKSDSYTRNCMYRGHDFELLLLCWNPKDGTSIHNHDGQKCWVYQIAGSIEEVRYEKNEAGDLIESHSLTLPPGSLSYMDDKMGYHALINSSETKALTLHLYMQPIDSCEFFCQEDRIFKSKALACDSSVNEETISP